MFFDNRIYFPRAVLVAVICIGFGVVVQFENYLLYVQNSFVDRIWFLLRFPFLHLETLLVGVALGAGYWVCARWVGRV